MRQGKNRVLLLAGAAVVALATSSVPAAAPGQNVRVNAPNAETLARVHLNSGVAVDPSNPQHLLVADTFQPSHTGARVCYRYRSTDGGGTWSEAALPIPGGYRACNVQAGVRVAADGHAYIVGLLQVSDGSALALGIYRSVDRGVSFEPPVIVQPAANGTVRASVPGAATIVTDRTTSWLPYLVVSPADPSRLYVAFTRCQTDGATICRAVFTSSTDRGLTWSAPVYMAPERYFTTAQGALHPTFGVGPAGEIISIFLDSKSGIATTGPLLLVKSTDGGRTFTTKEIGAAVDYPVRGRTAVHGSNIYFVYEDQRPDEPAGRVTGTTVRFPAPRKIVYLRSTDGGATFEPERALNTDGPGKDHTRPVISVAPNGRVDVWWYGSEFTTENRYFDVVYTYSTDGGATFQPAISVTETPIDSLSGPGQAQLFYHYMASTDDAAYIVWTDTRNDPEFGANDTYFARVDH